MSLNVEAASKNNSMKLYGQYFIAGWSQYQCLICSLQERAPHTAPIMNQSTTQCLICGSKFPQATACVFMASSFNENYLYRNSHQHTARTFGYCKMTN